MAGHLPKAETEEERDKSTICRNHHFTHTLQPEGRSTARRPRTDTFPLGLNRRLFLHACLQLRHGIMRNLIAMAHDTEWSTPRCGLAIYHNEPRRTVRAGHVMHIRSAKVFWKVFFLKKISWFWLRILEFALFDEHKKNSCIEKKVTIVKNIQNITKLTYDTDSLWWLYH